MDFFKATPDTILINHMTSQTIYHWQDEWLNLKEGEETKIEEQLKSMLDWLNKARFLQFQITYNLYGTKSISEMDDELKKEVGDIFG